MDLSSFDKDPWSKERPALDAIKADHALSPRAARLLRDLALLLAIVVLLLGLRVIATAIEHQPRRASAPPPPLPFDLVMERFEQVQTFDTREHVEELLGPPSNRLDLTVELAEHMELAELWHRGVGIPETRVWRTWSAPKDDGKWVAILFAQDKVYYKAKHGF